MPIRMFGIRGASTTVSPWMIWLGAGLAVLSLGIGGGVLVRDIVSDEETDLAVDDEARREDLAGARTILMGRFPDAERVTFDRVFVHGDGDARAVCGFADVVEPDDGFDGPERFVFQGGQLVLEETEGSDAVSQKWKDVCEG